MSDDLRDRVAALTRRQRDVLGAAAKGLNNEEIGSVLSISPATVKTHLAAVYRVLDVSNRTEAVGLLAELETHGSHSASARPKAPAIAVLPFVSAGGEPQRVFAEAIAEDLISRLSRHWFPVIARGSSFLVHAAGGYDPRKAGRDLDATFLVEGRVDQGAGRVQVHARVVDADSGRVVWGDSFRSARADLFSVQDELCGAIVESIGNAVVGAIAGDTNGSDVPSLQPWELAARGMWHYWKATPADNTRARSLAERALGTDPGLKLGLYTTALTYQRQVAEQWGRPQDAVAALSQAAARFADMHPGDPWACITHGYASLYVGDFSAALAHVDHAIEREPSCMRAHSLRGQLLGMDGRADDAVDALGTAMRLSPQDPGLSKLECAMGLAHFVACRYERAVYWAAKAAHRPGSGALPHGVLASSYGHLGELEAAGRSFAALKRLQPTFSEKSFQPMVASTRPEIAARYLDGLKRAADAVA